MSNEEDADENSALFGCADVFVISCVFSCCMGKPTNIARDRANKYSTRIIRARVTTCDEMCALSLMDRAAKCIANSIVQGAM